MKNKNFPLYHISIGQFTHLEENYLLEIGRMIGGWLKWVGAGGFKRKIFNFKFLVFSKKSNLKSLSILSLLKTK